ncbi:hypothetical protein BJY01DRAFT_202857 [Aspergillus pseudoustus]|uniref:Rrn9 domain-containing protein n=1 Tax=Aspergillus pseudoustus TaxID=1810923 RepID=A0ABR4KXY6_9EURO
MSFYSDDRIPQSSAPTSAQPYRSLFGGSSQDVIEHEGQSRFHGDAHLEYTVVRATTRGGPDTAEEDFDDDNAYISEIEGSELPENSNSSLPGPSGTYLKSTFEGREYLESSQSPPSYRPNRFHGPADMWLKLTRDDREIVEALEEIRAGDLAAHLYNAYTLQSQGVPKLENTIQPETDTLVDTYSPGNLDQWAAWPMPSDEVPRPDERLRRLEDDKWTYRLKPDPRPSAALEESIIAFLLKAAKDRFRSREWDSSTPVRKADTSYPKNDGGKAKLEGGFESDGRITDTRRLGQKSDTEDGKSDTEWESERENLRRPQRPTFQIDDDVSRLKLRPLARNVITQFEHLLMGLHHFHGSLGSNERSRSRGRKRRPSSSWASDEDSVHSGRASPNASEAESRSDAPDVFSRSTSAKKKHAKLELKLDRSQSRGRKLTRTMSQSQPRHKNAGEIRTSGPRSSSRAIHVQSGLTDWTDVLGVASMVGLPLAVLRRATARFSALSNEDAAAPPIDEGPSEDFTENVLRWASAQNNLAAGEDKNFLRSAVVGQSPSSNASYTGGRSTSPEEDRPKKTKSSKRNTADNEKILVCPFKKCPRHEKGFSRVWNLNQHLKNMHPNYQLQRDKSRNRRAGQTGYDPDQSE